MIGCLAMEPTELIDKVYEAAFLPDSWSQVLQQIGDVTESVSGTLLVFEDFRPIRFRATPLIQPWTEMFCHELWRSSNRLPYVRKNPYTGFTVLNRYFSEEFLKQDPSHLHRVSLGLDSEIATAISMPTGEMVVYSFDKLRRDGSHGEVDIAALNRLHPHLARAGLIAARLGVERAVTTTVTLQMIGLPAAVLTASGRMIATNPLFEELFDIFLPVAFGRLAIANIGANKLFQQAIEAAADQVEPKVRSVPIAETENHDGCVVHLVPLRYNALDLFPGGAIVIAISIPRKTTLVPSADILTGLFDLTPAETRFAVALAADRSLREAAQKVGITESSGRTYLARIFAKTGTHRQSELINLLQTTQPFREA